MDIPAQQLVADASLQQQETVKSLQRSRDRFESLNQLLEYKARDRQDFLDYALDKIIILTKSKIGYIYFYSEEKKEFELNSWSKDVMKDCTITNPQTVYQLEKTGVWGEVVRQRKPIVLNDFHAPHSLKKGYPEGHAPLSRFLSIPVFENDKIVAVVGIANKETDYDEYDIEQTTAFMDTVWKMIGIMNIERRQKDKDEQFQAIVDSTMDSIVMADDQDHLILWNKASEKIFGYMEKEVLGKELHSFFPALSEHRTEKTRLREFQKSGESALMGKILELSVMKKDGTQLDIELSIAKVNLHGKWYAVGVMRDISERKKTEQKLKEKMEELERMNTLMIGRELKMVELKNENNQLKEKLGKV